jgi:hypothetical protein
MVLQKTDIESFSIGNECIKGTIDTNKVGKIFQLLSNLYSNREEIILQECVANSQDSYTRISKEGVVNIKFDSSDRTLHIIDKAEGISPFVFQNYFTKLGSSTKELEENSAGTLGIGSMSSWTLVNCFYLTTVFNKVKYIYSCSKRDYEEPEFNLLLEEETEEENGTDYWFYLPNSTSSYRDTEKEKFEKALEKLRYFYNVTVEGLKFQNDYKIYQGKTFVFNDAYFKNLDYPESRELEICFGNTPYPINWEKIDIPKIYVPVALKFELNEPLMILPSREALGWNNTTIECVKNKIIDFVEEITEIYKEQTKPFDNILDFLKARDNKQKIKIGNSLINISSLKLESNLEYSKISHLDIKVPTDNDLIFKEFSEYWNPKYTKKRGYYSKPDLYNTYANSFYYSEEGVKKNKTSEINYDAILKHDLLPKDYLFEYKYYFKNKATLTIGNSFPDNSDEQIREFYQYVKEDIKSRFEDYDSVVPAKRIVNTVKRNNTVYIAAFNGDTKKEDYNINRFVAPKYLFITDNRDEYNKIVSEVTSFIKKTKDRKCNIVDVIYTAKKYHHLFSGCNIVTLDEWYKSDMFINAFRRNIQRYNFKQIYNVYFFDWLKTFNKRLYFLYKDDKSNYDYKIVYRGLDLKIPYPDNYQELSKARSEYNKISDTNLYKKDRIIKFLRSKLTKCKK